MSAAFTVIVAGRDAPLWLAAAALARALGASGVRVEAVELPSALAPVDVYATFPALEALHAQLRIDEAGLLRATGGSLTLGQNFVELEAGQSPELHPGVRRGTVRVSPQPQPPFLHAYGSAGARIGEDEFFPHWVKARAHGLNVPLDDFSLTAAAARHGRLMLPDDQSAGYGRCDYGYHLPAIPYSRLLREAAIHNGVTVHTADRVIAERQGETIAALDLGEGQRLAGDLFVDTGGALDADFLSWRGHFPADRVLTAAGPAFASLPVYAENRAGPTGWTALQPSRPATCVTHAWSSAHASDEEALAAATTASGLPLTGAVIRTLDPGRPAQPWTGNQVMLGARFDPVHGLDLLGLQVSLVQLLADFPAGAGFAAERDAYNHATTEALDRLRDFQSAHYALARYAGPFWEGAREVSPDLAHAIALFRARGELAPFEEENLPPDSWRALFLGHGVEPESWPPAIDRASPEEVKAQFRRMLGFVREQVLRQPMQDAWLARLAAPQS
ncbi:tryptophan halogenase [Sphingomonas kyeonggiensis]|uniref:Tryptophan halogenase n=1 Tax=Sphingomonas kyeonggiensis TaxID=1268553 RepID=A0A7W7K4B0_9SPHN|nr:tryptophan 7-halogenase [Sphingomonas kyeonggiensis]MBB4840774.1 tryptophan halogenase [Sphingomonas kyeonggiensis]